MNINELIKKYEKEIYYWQHLDTNLTNEQHAIYKTELDILKDLKQLKEDIQDKIFNDFDVLSIMTVEECEMGINKDFIEESIIGTDTK